MTATMEQGRTLTGKSMVEGVRPSARTVRRSGGLFRILVGIHFGDGPVGCRCEDCERDELYLADRTERLDTLRRAVDECKDVAQKAELTSQLKWVVSRLDRARNHVYRARRVYPIRDSAGVTHDPDPVDYAGDLIDSPNFNLETMNQPGSYKFERVHEGNTPSMLGPVTPDELARRGYSGTLPQAPANEAAPSPATSLNPTGVAKVTNGTDAAKKLSATAKPDLDTMSTQGLRELAESEEVDISKCKTREEMLKTVKAALGNGGK